MKCSDLETVLQQRAMMHVGRVLVRIRALSQEAKRRPESLGEILGKIESLSDSAHNIPQLIVTMGETAWASPDTLVSEVAICEAALLAS